MTVLFGLCLWGLFVITDMVFAYKDFMFDENVFTRIKPWVSQTNTNIMLVITFLGSQYFLLPANLFLIFYYLLIKENKKNAFKIATISVTSVLVMFFIKYILHRERPLVPLISQVHGYSFPSGHTFTSVTFYGILGYIAFKNIKHPILRWMAVLFLICLVFLVGFSRVYLRLHYASDVIAGFCLGVIWLLFAKWFLLKTEETKFQHNL